jgi:Esterase-like activity of phytase
VGLAVVAASAIAAMAGIASADGGGAGKAFNHVGTFSVPANLRSGEDIDTVTSAEIVDSTLGGLRLVYTDSPTGRLGFVDIVKPGSPKPAGAIDVGGEPTSVATFGGVWALAAVNTRTDPDGDGPLNEFDAPSGELVVVNTLLRAIVKRIPLAGQPDSVAISPDGRYAAIVIENERDEDENDGLIPQLPAGSLQVLDLKRLFLPGIAPGLLRTVALTGLADTAPSDPEPEFVDVNARNEAVVSLQENNHLAIIDLKTATVRRHFSAGEVVLDDVDATEEELGPQGTGLIKQEETITRRREPDAVAWIDNDTFATANEGDYADENGDEGGSRGFTLFNKNGSVEYESGSSFEHEVARVGHYPEARSANKGSEPEGLEVGKFGGRTLLFVGAERADVVGVYDVTGRGAPRFLQILPTGIGPEGLKAIPGRDLLAVSAETDGKADGFNVRSLVTLYKLERGAPKYPFVRSADGPGGLPIPWVALSGLAGDPHDADTIWAVSDSFLAQGYVYRVDVSARPAVIEQRIPVGGIDVSDQTLGDFDLEGIAARPEGGFWLASEGRVNVGSSRPNLIVRTDPAGAVLQSVPLPAGLVAGATSSGFEGVTLTGSEAGGDETVWVVIQREWADDPRGFVKIGRYDVAGAQWTFALYPLDPVESPSGGVVGLSEITILPGGGGTAAIVERDDRIGLDARIKRIYGVDLLDPAVAWKPYGEPLAVVRKTLLRDVLGDLAARSISVPDKLEGLGISADRRVFLATDNDGVDENYGETLFFDLGSRRAAFAR